MKKILILIVFISISLSANPYCEKYTKEVNKSIMQLNSTLDTGDYSAFTLSYKLFLIDYNNFIGEGCGSTKIRNLVKSYKNQFGQMYDMLKTKGY